MEDAMEEEEEEEKKIRETDFSTQISLSSFLLHPPVPLHGRTPFS